MARFTNVVAACLLTIVLVASLVTPPAHAAPPAQDDQPTTVPQALRSNRVWLPMLERPPAPFVIYKRPLEANSSADAFWRVDLNGTNNRQIALCFDGCGIEVFQVSPDGTQIAYLANYEPSTTPSQLRILATNGSADRVLLAQTIYTTFAFSPDGKQIVFGQSRSVGNQFESSIWLVDTASGTTRQLTPWGRNGGPLWLSNEQILYMDYTPSNSPGNLMRINVAGTPQPELIFQGASAMELAPDRKTLFALLEPVPFTDGPGPSQEFEFGVLQIAGTGATVQYRWKSKFRASTWSPDSTRLALGAQFTIDVNTIEVAEKNGTRTVVKDFSAETGWDGGSVEWSPNGRNLIYLKFFRGSELRILNLDTRSEQTLAIIPDGAAPQFVVVP